jgi:NitT/TauT family transport system substrate-binding protein
MLVSGYEHNDVDAVVCFEPYATQLSKLGARRLIDSSQFPGVIVDVLASKQSALTGAPRSLEQLLAGYFQAFSVLQNSPTQAAELMAPALGIRAQEVTRALRGVRMKSLTDNRTLLVGPSPELVSMAQSVSALMLSSGLLKARANLDKLVDSRFLPTA